MQKVLKCWTAVCSQIPQKAKWRSAVWKVKCILGTILLNQVDPTEIKNRSFEGDLTKIGGSIFQLLKEMNPVSFQLFIISVLVCTIQKQACAFLFLVMWEKFDAGLFWFLISAKKESQRSASLFSLPFTASSHGATASVRTHRNDPSSWHRWWLRRTAGDTSWFCGWRSCRQRMDRFRPSSAPRPSNCWRDCTR